MSHTEVKKKEIYKAWNHISELKVEVIPKITLRLEFCILITTVIVASIRAIKLDSSCHYIIIQPRCIAQHLSFASSVPNLSAHKKKCTKGRLLHYSVRTRNTVVKCKRLLSTLALLVMFFTYKGKKCGLRLCPFQ